MDKTVNSYETLFVVDLTQGDEAVDATVEKFTTLIADNAKIIEIAKWGKKTFAYPINDMNEGYYVIVTFKSEPAFPSELERLLNIDESIMRSLTIRLDFDAEERAAAKQKAAEEAERIKAEKLLAEKAEAEKAEAERLLAEKMKEEKPDTLESVDEEAKTPAETTEPETENKEDGEKADENP